MNDHDVTAVLERLIESLDDERGSWDDVLERAAAPRPDDWDEALDHAEAARDHRPAREPLRHRRGRRRRRVVALVAAALLITVVSASAFGSVRHLLFKDRRSTPAWAGAPTWSPDGKRIAFVSLPVGCSETCGNPVEVSIMNADGSQQRNLTREWRQAGPNAFVYSVPPVLSPDWRKLAFAQERGASRGDPVTERYTDLYVMDADGRRLRRLARSPQNDGDPVWSPDGRRLAFVRVHGGSSDIYVVNADGSELRRLAHAITFKPFAGGPSGGFGANPAWSPDGRTIAFMSNRDGTDDIFVVNAGGGGLQNLTRSHGHDRTRIWDGREHKRLFWYSSDGPMWSPDGRRIVFRSERDRPSASEQAACRPRCERDEIYVINADGSGLRRLTHNWRSDGGPVWSPDGRKILFTRSGDIYVMTADGKRQRNLTDSATYPHAGHDGASWSPDGSKILFVSNRGGNSEVYVMNADGSGKRRLTHLKGQD